MYFQREMNTMALSRPLERTLHFRALPLPSTGKISLPTDMLFVILEQIVSKEPWKNSPEHYIFAPVIDWRR